MSLSPADEAAVDEYQPILLFNRGEAALNFFPSSVERFIEFAKSCSPGNPCAEGNSLSELTQSYVTALTNAFKTAVPIPTETASDWEVKVPRGRLSLDSMSPSPKAYIGTNSAGDYSPILPLSFMNLAGYATPSRDSPNLQYTTTKYADGGDLGDSKYYHYAEISDLAFVFPRNLAANKSFPDLANKPYKVLTYYFFYPAQKSDLIAKGDNIASHEADWGAVSILLRKESDGSLTPVLIGNSTSEGLPPGASIISIIFDYLKTVPQYQNISSSLPRWARMNADVRPWDDSSVDRVGNHPKIYVSLGNHNNYFSPGEKTRDGADELEAWVANAYQQSGVGQQLDQAKQDLNTITTVAAVICILGGILSFGLAAAACAVAIAAAMANSGIPSSSDVENQIMNALATKDNPPNSDSEAIAVAPASASASIAPSVAKFVPWNSDPRRIFNILEPRDIWWLYMGNWGVRLDKSTPPKALDGSLRPDFAAIFVGDPVVLEYLALH